MCGIVGYIGQRDATSVLLNGLKRLEYRGYDSSGIAVAHENHTLEMEKATGKIANLACKLSQKPMPATIGIAHTRWATHGAPSENNAHPQVSYDGKIMVVHNGIIENYSQIKATLQSEGIRFQSETDTEVVAHLIAKLYKGDFKSAVLAALNKLEGTFGLAILCADEPDVLIGARRGSPLVLGLGEQDEFFLASDVSAIVDYTQKVVYLDDNDVVIADRNGYKIVTVSSRAVNRCVEEVNFDADAASKGGFEHYMLKEIFEQPETLRNTMRGRLLLSEGSAKLAGLDSNRIELRNLNRIIITACGTSYYAGMVGEYLI